MTLKENERNRIKSALIDFIVRAASEQATSEETRVLPEVARVLLTCADEDDVLMYPVVTRDVSPKDINVIVEIDGEPFAKLTYPQENCD